MRLTGVHVNHVLTLNQLGLMGPDTTYIHCTDSTDEELDLIAETGGSASVAPFVEMLMGHGVPPTGRLVARGVRPSLSIDVVSSVPGEMFTQMRTALVQERILAFTETPDTAFAPTLTHRDVLEFATIDGARACALDHKIGTITPGKQADIVLLRDRPGQRRADHRSGGDRRHLRRHVEHRHGVRRREGGQAQRPARRRDLQRLLAPARRGARLPAVERGDVARLGDHPRYRLELGAYQRCALDERLQLHLRHHPRQRLHAAVGRQGDALGGHVLEHLADRGPRSARATRSSSCGCRARRPATSLSAGIVFRNSMPAMSRLA